MKRAFAAAACLILAGLSVSARPRQSAIETYHVQGNVYMLVGADCNIAVQVGDDGVLVVDDGGEATADDVLAAIRELSDGPIRWMVNTHAHPDHTGANAKISQAGKTVNGNPAAIIAHENVPLRMVELGRPPVDRPVNTFFEDKRDFYFNGEAILIYHVPRAHTDGDIIVYFRGSDVIVSGDIFVTTTFPLIDLELGGGIGGFLDGLDLMLDIAVPAHLQDGGTYVIPGHGRVSDEADVLEYRDMVYIIRDRIAAMIDEGMSLEDVLDARPALDYTPRYGNAGGDWTTRDFVEAAYRSLSGPSSE